MLEPDDFSSIRHPALCFCLSMISAQTRSAFVARENRYPPIGSWPEGMLFRIMLYCCAAQLCSGRRYVSAPDRIRAALFERAFVGRAGVNAFQKCHRLGMPLIESAACGGGFD